MTPSPEPHFDSKAFLSAVTHQSGVYRMYDSGGTVIYVGKARISKKRLASYFRANVDSIKTRTLVRQIADAGNGHPHRDRGADPRAQPHQAVPAPLQRAAAG